MNGLSDNLKGALFMAVAMTAFTCNDTALKSLSDLGYPLYQLLAVRGTIVTVALLALAAKMGQLTFTLPAREWRLIGLRSVVEAAAAYTFLTALFKMPLALVTAIMQSLPLVLTLAGAVFFGEKVGWRRYLAIIIGFIGVMLIVQPTGSGFNIYSIFALATVVVVAIRDLAARQLDRSTPSLMVAACAAAAVALFGFVMLPGTTWVPITWQAAGLIGVSSCCVLVGYLLSVLAMRVGEIAFVSPMRYVGLVMALILGFVVFDELPDALELIGALIVVATGLFTFYREHVARQRIKAAQGLR